MSDSESFIKTLGKWEIARLEAVAIRRVDCTFCTSKKGRPCQINSRNGIGSHLPGYAHISRQLAWLELAEMAGESPLPAICEEDEERIFFLYGPDPAKVESLDAELDALMEGPGAAVRQAQDELADLIGAP